MGSDCVEFIKYANSNSACTYQKKKEKNCCFGILEKNKTKKKEAKNVYEPLTKKKDPVRNK